MIKAIAAAVALVPIAACTTAPGMERTRLRVTLTGLQVAPGPGDGDGSGTAEVRTDPVNARVYWDLYARDIGTATAAHLHRGAAGSTGPVVATLTTPDADGRSEGCVDGEQTTVRDIGLHPHLFYVDVHSAGHSDGAIRGQLRGEIRVRRPQRR